MNGEQAGRIEEAETLAMVSASRCSCPCVHCSTGNCWMCHGDDE